MNRLLPLLLLLHSTYVQSDTHGNYCQRDSECDQRQICAQNKCRCSENDRYFWTGIQCLVCDSTFVISQERCYQLSTSSKTWTEARTYCRTKNADLFTWRHNNDESFIRPILKNWISTSGLILSPLPSAILPSQPRAVWSSATIISFQPHTTKWTDPDGLSIDPESRQWCKRTHHVDYTLENKPSQNTKTDANGTHREECVTYNFDSYEKYFCLANDYCSQKYPFVCEINAFSIRLASSTQNGGHDIDTSSQTNGVNSKSTQIQTQTLSTTSLPDQSGSGKDETEIPSALSEKEGMLSKTNLMVFGGVGILLVVGAVAGYMVIQKKKTGTGAYATDEGNEGPSQGRPSFTSSVGSMMDG